MIPAAAFIIFVARPLTGIVSFWGSGLSVVRRWVISFYGIRGIGSIYYLLYAFYHAQFGHAREVLALVTVVILFSVFVHGLSARSIMRRFVKSD